MTVRTHHRVVVAGGGSAGLSVAARLLRAGQEDVAVVEPADLRYPEPLWTLVGGGCAPVGESARFEASVMPAGASWIRQAATTIDPDAGEVELADESRVGSEAVVVCPGIQLDWGRIGAMTEGWPDQRCRATTPTTWHRRRGTWSAR